MNNSPYLDLPPECLRLITEAMVPAMASAIIREGRLDRYVCCGPRLRGDCRRKWKCHVSPPER